MGNSQPHPQPRSTTTARRHTVVVAGTSRQGGRAAPGPVWLQRLISAVCFWRDQRGNDLAQLRGNASFRQVVIDRAQTLQLAEALAAELDVTYSEGLDDK